MKSVADIIIEYVEAKIEYEFSGHEIDEDGYRETPSYTESERLNKAVAELRTCFSKDFIK